LPIGRGAFGAVHVGIMKNSGKRVALKTLYLKQYSCEEELYKDFVKEVVVQLMYERGNFE